MNHKQVVLLSSVCVAFFAAACSSAGAEDAVNAPEAQNTIQVPAIDEVIVATHRGELRRLQAEINKSEDAVYDEFNQVNTERQYRTYCGMDTQLRWKVHECKPEFISDAFQEAMITGNFFRAAIMIDSTMFTYRQHVREVAQKDPNLRKALGRYYALTQRYDAVRKVKFKDKWIVFDP